ncbi:hypothetical protein PoB_000068700 [Plakobranchus ocellatus]|uniref:Uncharacterized protein n=1 Tax=Plakobranchus ocellatus TaxID=259542 RepID=A0AAV3XWF2_9GAST|nr:hypothetical protein PoB_000068700 [Plakobranchus ocellatus]
MVGATTTRTQALRETATRPLMGLLWRGKMELVVDPPSTRRSGDTRTFPGRQLEEGTKPSPLRRSRALYTRDFKDPRRNINWKRVVLPMSVRGYVMSLAHDSITGAHFEIRNTTDKFLSNFYG